MHIYSPYIIIYIIIIIILLYAYTVNRLFFVIAGKIFITEETLDENFSSENFSHL